MAFVSLKPAIAIALLSTAGTALADPAPAGTPTAGTSTTGTPTTGTTTASSTPGTPAPATTEAPIATPPPDAPQSNVDAAKAISKKAELTPIVPTPNPLHRAFQLYAEIDPPILATGTVFALARLTKTQPAFCAPLCDKNASGLNSLDKLTVGYYSASWSTASDYMLYGLGAGTAALLVVDEGLINTLNDGVVIGEATLSATAVASIMTIASGRPRPLLYSDSAPLDVRNSGDSGLSFLSSHTAEAFAIVTSLYVAERRLHPNSMRPKIILAGGLGVASMIGVARVMSGYHFITDVVGGAVVGASLGVLIASVHGAPVRVVPVVNSESKTGPVTGPTAGLGVQGSF